MAHRVDAEVHRVQTTARNPVLDRILSESQLQQLPPRDNSMLSLCHRGEPRVQAGLALFLSPSPRQCAYTTISRGLGGHAPRLAGNIALVARGL
jgi:hypothetical protein